jgi:hypothetical protein
MGSAPGRKPSVSSTEAVTETYSSVSTLARAFGAPVLEPAWWPADVGQISYVLARFPDRALHRIDSTRHDEVPICVIGHREVPGAGRAAGERYEPRELAPVRGLIGRVGIPPRLQALVHHEKLAIHLIGYETEEEIISAARSLRQVSAD